MSSVLQSLLVRRITECFRFLAQIPHQRHQARRSALFRARPRRRVQDRRYPSGGRWSLPRRHLRHRHRLRARVGVGRDAATRGRGVEANRVLCPLLNVRHSLLGGLAAGPGAGGRRLGDAGAWGLADKACTPGCISIRPEWWWWSLFALWGSRRARGGRVRASRGGRLRGPPERRSGG